MNIDQLAGPAYFTRTSSFHSRLLRTCPQEKYLSDLFATAADISAVLALFYPFVITETGLSVHFQIIGNKFRFAELFGLAFFFGIKVKFRETNQF